MFANAVPLSELDGLARRFAGDRHDEYSASAVARAYDEYLTRRRHPLAHFALIADGKEYPTFYALLADPAAKFATGELRLEPVPALGPAWEFLLPFERVEFHDDGSADLHPIALGPSTRAIARFLLRDFYLPRSHDEESRAAAGGVRREPGGVIPSVSEGVAACRAQALLPFSVAVLLYLPEERHRYELDLIHSTVLTDPRAGRFPITRRVRRTSRLSWGVDRAVARGELSPLGASCLEVLVESSGMTSAELAYVFGGVRELVESALQGLVARGVVTVDHRTGIYRPRLDRFLPTATASPAPVEPVGRVSDPALRTSVQELIAAADARAVCPLCGAALPAGPKSILCANCAAQVGAA